jgi:phosphoribosyl-AMP cyclohydrolase
VYSARERISQKKWQKGRGKGILQQLKDITILIIAYKYLNLLKIL